MPEITPVEQYLLDEDLIPSRDLPPDKAVKPHLYERLKDWCIRQKITTHQRGEAWRHNLDSPLTDRGEMMCVELKVVANSLQDLDAFIDYRHDRLLRVIDWLVREQAKPLTELLARERPDRFTPERWDDYVENERRLLRNRFAPLEELLSRGGSAWRVDVDPAGLFERVTDEERETFAEATSEQDAATEHLNAAWKAAWRLDPDGQTAFDEAIKAVEAALKVVVTPDDKTSQLGRILGEIAASPGRYTSRLERTVEGSKKQASTRFDNEGVQMVHGLAGSLWRSHRRHGQPEKRDPHDIEEGRDAVTLAVALIAMQRRGFLRRAEGQ